MLSLIAPALLTGALAAAPAADASGPELAAKAAAAAAGGPTPGLSWAGFILWLPLISAAICWLLSARKVRNKLPAFITIAALGGAFATTLALAFTWSPEGPPATVELARWISLTWGDGPAQSFVANVDLHIDGLSVFWMLFVTGLGTLIAIFASEYMESDVGGDYARFFAAVSLFLFAMGCLVLGGNLLLLYLGWEGVGVASYLLIGYYYGKPTAVAAAKKAFIMNRVGDLGLLVGIYLVWRNFGSLDYAGIFSALAASGGEAAVQADWTAQLIPYFLMLGAFGKSAQIPLFTWLPDAMEGPTPVSALIHAATMVTAGVYLIARTYPLFLLHPDALPTVAWIGGLTAFVAATIALLQYDLKRVFAYSTVSQLGFMFLGLGVGTSYAACYHVFTHAFFKALLFLASGAVMHGFAGQLDIRKLSGLRLLPGFKVVSWTMLVGCLWLAAFPFTAGFFSKDEILYVAITDHARGNALLGWLGLFTALLTAYYTFRVWFRVCGGPVAYQPGEDGHGHGADDHGHGHGHDDHGHGHGDFHPHPPRLAINGVLAILAIGAVLAGLPSYLKILTISDHHWVETMIGASSAAVGVPSLSASEITTGGHAHAHGVLFGMDGHLAMMILSTIVGIVGIAAAAWFHLINRAAADSLKRALVANPLVGWLPRAIENKWYVDELYDALFRVPTVVAGSIFAFIDRYILDGGLVNGTGRLPAALGRVFQPLYNGFLQGYALLMAGGVGLILAWILFVWVYLRGGGA